MAGGGVDGRARLRCDENRALKALPMMLPTEQERREAVDIVRPIGYADGENTLEGEVTLGQIERILGLGRGEGKARDRGPAGGPKQSRGRMKKEQDPIEVAPLHKAPRDYRVYPALIERCASLEPVTTAVAHPCDAPALTGVVEAAEADLIRPTLVGPERKIRAVAEQHGIDISPYRLIDAPHSHAAAAKAVEIVRSGETETLMKGSLHTDELMAEVIDKETGLRTERRVSHAFVMDVPTYPKPLAITDAAINIFPDLEDKRDIVQNAIDMAHALGVPLPKIAIVSAVETVTPKIPSTIDAAALCKMAERGQITGGLLDGPLAFDNAVSKEAAEIKGIRSEVAGDADILLVPDLEAGNMLAKQLSFLANADAAGVVLGARVPIILTSRADTVRARMASCAVAVCLAHARRRQAAGPAAE